MSFLSKAAWKLTFLHYVVLLQLKMTRERHIFFYSPKDLCTILHLTLPRRVNEDDAPVGGPLLLQVAEGVGFEDGAGRGHRFGNICRLEIKHTNKVSSVHLPSLGHRQNHVIRITQAKIYTHLPQVRLHIIIHQHYITATNV